MDIPDFKNDKEMAEWFEANDVDTTVLEVDESVVIADDLALTIINEVYAFAPSNSGSATSASTVDEGDRDLTPAGA
jgi:hypothetical protein